MGPRNGLTAPYGVVDPLADGDMFVPLDAFGVLLGLAEELVPPLPDGDWSPDVEAAGLSPAPEIDEPAPVDEPAPPEDVLPPPQAASDRTRAAPNSTDRRMDM